MFLDRGIVGKERNPGSRQAIGARSNLAPRDNKAHFFRYKTRLQPHIHRCLSPPRRPEVGEQQQQTDVSSRAGHKPPIRRLYSRSGVP
jgi:hypothetical protein